jgi:hypothetical protein
MRSMVWVVSTCWGPRDGLGRHEDADHRRGHTRRQQNVAVLETGATPTEAGIDGAVAQATANDVVVVSTMNAASVGVATGQPTASAAASRLSFMLYRRPANR